MRETKIWFNEEHVKSFKVCGETKYETSVSEIQKDAKELSENWTKNWR